jgi:hypothetical protein
MTYVLFVYDRADSLTGMREEAQQAIFAEYQALQALPGLVGHRLEAASRATTVRHRDHESTIEHKPFDPDLPLAGFYLLDTDDREHAIEIAARIPAARLGGAVEIRPLQTEAHKIADDLITRL